MRVAIVHERLTEVAGSEQVVAQLATQWPDAQVTIPIVDPRVDIAFTDRVVSGSLSDAYRRLGYRSYVPLLPLVPSWLRRRELASADVVIISHHAFGVAAAHAAGTTPSVAYVHSPARWAWDEEMRKGEAASLPARAALDLLSRLAIANERRSAGRVTTVVASSSAVAACTGPESASPVTASRSTRTVSPRRRRSRPPCRGAAPSLALRTKALLSLQSPLRCRSIATSSTTAW